jgi:hypothetical protein
LQLYAQPLLSAGEYQGIKELAAPRTYTFPSYGADRGTLARDPADASYHIDPDGPGPAAAFRLADPDFDVRALRANAVLRWELRPGSTLYLVWTQRRQDPARPPFSFTRDARELLEAPSDDVLMVKLAWWFGR